MGCDLFGECQKNVPFPVSIHAPAWGATAQEPEPKHHRKGFQSTHPHGVRQKKMKLIDAIKRFNPRTRMGCDKYIWTIFASAKVSIHAPAWGATTSSPTQVHGEGFNPRTRMGCDAKLLCSDFLSQFQSTHPHGVRQTSPPVT